MKKKKQRGGARISRRIREATVQSRHRIRYEDENYRPIAVSGQ